MSADRNGAGIMDDRPRYAIGLHSAICGQRHISYLGVSPIPFNISDTMHPIFDAISVSFRPVTPEDQPLVLELYGIVRDPEFAPLGLNQQQRDDLMTMQLALMTQHYESHHPNRMETIILRDGEWAGRLIVMDMEEEVRLGDIMVRPEHRRFGICTSVMRYWVAEGIRKNKPITLHVERFNPAKNMYEREDFVVVGESPTHFLMEWQGDPEVALGRVAAFETSAQ
jgi:hypothetical protein